MAKPMAAGVGFRFSVSFRAIVGVYGLLVSGTGKAIAVGCACLVSCLAFGYVCKGVGWEGKYKNGNGCKCGIYIRVTQSANVKMSLTNPLTKL